MKTFLLLVLSLIALFVWQRQEKEAVIVARPQIEARSVAAAQPRPVSEHNWAKHSLDRAHEVANQVRESRSPAEQP